MISLKYGHDLSAFTSPQDMAPLESDQSGGGGFVPERAAMLPVFPFRGKPMR